MCIRDRITERDRVLFIGSGPFPITAIELYHSTGAIIDCIDKDRDSVTQSEQVNERLDLDIHIQILHAEGDNIDICPYSTIIIAILALPKKLILRNICNQDANDVQIICRTSDGLRGLLYKPTNEESLIGFKQITKKKAIGNQTISSVLLRPQNSHKGRYEE